MLPPDDEDEDGGGSVSVNPTPNDYAYTPEHGGNETPLQPGML